jgi:mRNA interferase RelE/StbE
VSDRYRLRLSSAARRALEETLPTSVAFAVWEFCRGSCLDNPYRVGKELDAPYAGKLAARRGDYRVIYRVDDGKREVQILRIDHRRDVYRPA